MRLLQYERLRLMPSILKFSWPKVDWALIKRCNGARFQISKANFFNIKYVAKTCLRTTDELNEPINSSYLPTTYHHHSIIVTILYISTAKRS